ncbi:MAG TPA: hypothetical protein VL947_02760, partial [Cytophagales bacterium]|nr:hypothetical protein [Cytophagales bacterium]
MVRSRFPERYLVKALYGLVLLYMFACGSKKDPKPSDEYEIEAPGYFGTYQIPTDNPMTRSGVNLGRHLFY